MYMYMYMTGGDLALFHCPWRARCLNLISVMSRNHSIMVHHVYSVNYRNILGAFGGYINPWPYTSLLVMSEGGLALFY